MSLLWHAELYANDIIFYLIPGVPPVCMTPPMTNVSTPIVIPGPMPIAPALRPVQPYMIPTGASMFQPKF